MYNAFLRAEFTMGTVSYIIGLIIFLLFAAALTGVILCWREGDFLPGRDIGQD